MEGNPFAYINKMTQNIEKKSQAPMFKPQKDMQWQNGMPSTTDYMQERMRNVVTSKMNNAKPWEEIQVGPGLNKINGRKGSVGFNSASIFNTACVLLLFF